jgi:hypothetical protein
MVIVASIYLRFYIAVGVGVGTFLLTLTPTLTLGSTQNSFQLHDSDSDSHTTALMLTAHFIYNQMFFVLQLARQSRKLLSHFNSSQLNALSFHKGK